MGNKKYYKIEMDFVCDQQWDAMPDKGAGKFCQQCSKTLIDFTNLTDSEVFEYLKKPHVCGKISEAQLHRPLNLPFEHQITWWKKMAMGLGLLSMWGGNLLAFNRKLAPKISTEKKLNSDDKTANKFPIKGKVSLENMTADCSKIKVNLDGTDIVGYTDSLGNFELMIPDTLELEPLKFNFYRADLMPLEYHLKQINKADFIAVMMDEKETIKTREVIDLGGNALGGLGHTGRINVNPVKHIPGRIDKNSVNDIPVWIIIKKNKTRIPNVRLDIYKQDTLLKQGYSDSNGYYKFTIEGDKISIKINVFMKRIFVYSSKVTVSFGLNPIIEIDLTETQEFSGLLGAVAIRRWDNLELINLNIIDLNSNIQTIKNPINNPVIRE